MTGVPHVSIDGLIVFLLGMNGGAIKKEREAPGQRIGCLKEDFCLPSRRAPFLLSLGIEVRS